MTKSTKKDAAAKLDLEDYHAQAMSWRDQLRHNTRKTRVVIAIFIAIYLAVGFLVDAFILQSASPQTPLSSCFTALFTLRATPIATLLMGTIAGVALLITYAFYDRLMLLGTDSREITATSAKTLQEKQLFHVLEEMKIAAGLHYLPKVYLIEANYMNAFASGYSEKSAMIAITRGLLEKLDRAELQAVMAHELSHIRHHDIKLTLTVAILSNILLIVVDTLFYTVLFKRERRGDNRLATVIMLLRYVLPLITAVLTLFLRRTREYMADSGAVALMRDNEPMARALLKISQDHSTHAAAYNQEYGQTAHEQVRQVSYLYDPSAILSIHSVGSLFSTHPTIDKRLAAIGFKPR